VRRDLYHDAQGVLAQRQVRDAWRGSLRNYAGNLGPMVVADITTYDVFEAVNPIWLEHNSNAKNLRSRVVDR
jgi:hypothetical protein